MPQQHQIQTAVYTIAQGNAVSLTHWVRPGIEPITSWILVRFVTCWATTGTPVYKLWWLPFWLVWGDTSLLICISLMVILSIFSCFPFLPFVCLLWRKVYLDLLTIFRLPFVFKSKVVWRLIHGQLLCLQVFSHSVGCLFILFMVSFAVQKLLSLIRSYLFTFIFITLGGGSKRYCCDLHQRVFCLCFPLRAL